MRCYSRLLLVGLLVANLAVDCTATGRLFRRGCGNGAELLAACCIQYDCCVDCLPPGCDTSIPASADPCCIDTMAVETAASDCCVVDEQPFAPTNIESTPLDESSESATAAEAPPALPATTPTPAPSLPPPQVAVPTAPETHADSMPEAPATPSKPAPSVVGDRYSDDSALFDTPAPTTPEPVAPESITPEPTAPKDSANDIFDEPEFDEPETAEEPTNAILPPTQSAPAKNAPKQTETKEDKPKEDLDFSELFGDEKPTATQEIPNNPDAEPPANTPEEPTQPAPEETDDSFDPFDDNSVETNDSTSVLRSAGGLYSDEERTWTDNSAEFQCKARLIRVTVKNVVLRQSSGARVTLPLTRLGNQDLRFVHQQVVALRLARSHDASPTKLANAWE